MFFPFLSNPKTSISVWVSKINGQGGQLGTFLIFFNRTNAFASGLRCKNTFPGSDPAAEEKATGS